MIRQNSCYELDLQNKFKILFSCIISVFKYLHYILMATISLLARNVLTSFIVLRLKKNVLNKYELKYYDLCIHRLKS